MAHLLHSTVLVPAVAGLFVLACGGSTGLMDTDSGSGGSEVDGQSGGSSSTDGSADGTGTGGSAPGSGGGATDGEGGGDTGGGGGGGGQLGCCLAAAICDADDTQIASEADCPDGATCYERSICCSTIWCIDEPDAHCDAAPVCPEGTHEVSSCDTEDLTCSSPTLCGTTIHCQEDNPPSCGGGPTCPEGSREVSGCPEEGECTEESYCGETIYCLAETEACHPDLEYNREYVSSSAGSCAFLDFACEEGTTPFENECGCSCEQPSDCPEWVDCMPSTGSPTDSSALCSSDDCPFTLRAY